MILASPLGLGLVAVLSALAVLHLYWGLGGLWPADNAQSLADRVVGTRTRPMPGLVPSAFVALALVAAATIVVIGHSRIAYGLHALAAYGGYVVLILVFGLRGLAPYVTPAFNYARGTPFYTLNRRFYAPLCLAIATGLWFDFPNGVENFLSGVAG